MLHKHWVTNSRDATTEAVAWPWLPKPKHDWPLAVWGRIGTIAGCWLDTVGNSSRLVVIFEFAWAPDTKVAFFIFSAAPAHHLKNKGQRFHYQSVLTSINSEVFMLTSLVEDSLNHGNSVSFQRGSETTDLSLGHFLLQHVVFLLQLVYCVIDWSQGPGH